MVGISITFTNDAGDAIVLRVRHIARHTAVLNAGTAIALSGDAAQGCTIGGGIMGGDDIGTHPAILNLAQIHSYDGTDASPVTDIDDAGDVEILNHTFCA